MKKHDLFGRPPVRVGLARGGAALLAALALGCALPQASPEARTTWAWFEAPPDDVWTGKITDWQARQQRDAPALAAEPREARLLPPRWALLREKALSFEARERRALAARIAKFAQESARSHFRWDPKTDLAADPWPTSLELYRQNGDDCDGLDLIAYDLLVAFGFPEDELYRVVIQRDRDGANHMATLWFEDPRDPWLIDATGAITRFFVRFSELPGWTPLRLFDEDEVYDVAAR